MGWYLPLVGAQHNVPGGTPWSTVSTGVTSWGRRGFAWQDHGARLGGSCRRGRGGGVRRGRWAGAVRSCPLAGQPEESGRGHQIGVHRHRRIRLAPGARVEPRHYRHRPVTVDVSEGVAGTYRRRMQIGRPVAVDDAFRITGDVPGAGQVGPFRAQAEPVPGADDTMAVRVVIYDEGAGARRITAGSYAFCGV